MEGNDFKTFVILVAFVLTALLCCCGVIRLDRACTGRGGHFELVWGAERLTCVGGDR